MDTDSGPKWTVIPDQSSHPFRSKVSSELMAEEQFGTDIDVGTKIRTGFRVKILVG